MFWTGKFIVFEGCEGAGKSTQVQLLAESMRQDGYRVLLTREPGGRVGDDAGIAKIRALLVEAGNDWTPVTEVLLFAAARREHVERVIRPALAAGVTVICDRFSDSTLAYQGYGRGLGVEICDQLRDIACGDVRPDITLIVDIPAQDGLARSKRRATDATRFEQEDLVFHEKVREAFIGLAKADPGRYGVVDGSRSPSEVRHAIAEAMVRHESSVQ